MTENTDRPIIAFVDWDGVLNNADIVSALPNTKLMDKFMAQGDQKSLSPIAVGYLNVLCHDNPQIRIVCSSTWRIESKSYVEKSLKKAHSRLEKASGLGKIPYKIRFANTPPEAWRTEPGFEYDLPRGLAIDKWLNDFGADDQCYCIIDDDRDFFDWHLPRLIHTDPKRGLDLDAFIRAGKLLKDPPEDRQMKLGLDLQPIYDAHGHLIP